MKKIPLSVPFIGEEEINAVNETMKSGWISSLGENILKFENQFASFCDTKFALTVSNGTVGLHLALHSLNIGPGDEVIVPNFTFVATANSVLYTGATVRYADINPKTLCICPESIKSLINDNTKAIIPVHVYGHPSDMISINEIAKENRLKVIEDCAEAHGAELSGRKVGSFGDVGVFSFYGNKIITTGEGGMITTNDESLYKKMKLLRDHAMSNVKRYWHTEMGFNYRMTNIQAAIGIAQLNKIDNILEEKIKIYYNYKKALNSSYLKLNFTEKKYKNVFWYITVLIDKINETQRDEIIGELYKDGIDSRPFFYPLNTMPMLKNKDYTPVTDLISPIGICLPTFIGLTNTEIIYITKCLNKILKKYGI